MTRTKRFPLLLLVIPLFFNGYASENIPEPLIGTHSESHVEAPNASLPKDSSLSPTVTVPNDTVPSQVSEQSEQTVPPAVSPVTESPSELHPPTHTESSSASPLVIHQQIGVLLIDDQVQGNQYVTSLESSGMTLPGSGEPTLFGVRQIAGINKQLATWYPHRKTHDVQQILQGEPAQAFRGMASSRQQIEAGLNELLLPDSSYVNPLLSATFFDDLANLSIGAVQGLRLEEKLATGELRTIDSQLTKLSQITLQKPSTSTCQVEHLEGSRGWLCPIRDVITQGSLLQGGETYFLIRSSSEQSQIRYRVGQRWYPLNTRIPINEFNNSTRIELFVPLAENESGQTSSLPVSEPNVIAPLRAGFYSSSRLAQGDWFAIKLNASMIPVEEPTLLLRRLDIAVIEDRHTDNLYVTTLSSSGNRDQRPDSLLFGTRNASLGGRPAVWHALGHKEEPVESYEQATVVSPIEGFDGYASSSAQPSAHPTSSVFLSESGWQDLLALPVGDSRQWRYEVSEHSNKIKIFNHIAKQVSLQLNKPGSSPCRQGEVEGKQGMVCSLREVTWSDGGGVQGDIRFVLQGRLSTPDSYYRVDTRWHPIGESIALEEFVNSKAIEVFFTPSHTDEETQSNPSRVIERFNLSFFSAKRLSAGDRFVIQERRAAGLMKTPVALQQNMDFLLIEDQPTQNHYVSTLAKPDDKLRLSGVHHARSGAEKAVLRFESGSAPRSASPSLSSLMPAEWFEPEGGASSNETTRRTLSESGWSQLLQMQRDETLTLRLQLPDNRTTLTGTLNKKAHVKLSGPSTNACVDSEVNQLKGQICTLRRLTIEGNLPTDSLIWSVNGQLTPEGMVFRSSRDTAWFPLGEMRPFVQLRDGDSLQLFVPTSGPATASSRLSSQAQSSPETVPTEKQEIRLEFRRLSEKKETGQLTLPLTLPTTEPIKITPFSLLKPSTRADYLVRLLTLVHPPAPNLVQSGTAYVQEASLVAPVTTKEALNLRLSLGTNLLESDFDPQKFTVNGREVKGMESGWVLVPLKNDETSFKISVPIKPIYIGGKRDDPQKSLSFHFYSGNAKGTSWNATAVNVGLVPLPVSNVSGEDTSSDLDLKFTIETTETPSDGAGFFMKVTPETGKDWLKIIWNQAELTDGTHTVKTGDLSGDGRSVSFPHPITGPLTLKLPTQGWIADIKQSVTLSVNGGNSENTSTAKTATINVSRVKHRVLGVTQISPAPSIDSGSNHSMKGYLYDPVFSDQTASISFNLKNMQARDFKPGGVTFNERDIWEALKSIIKIPLKADETDLTIRLQTLPIYQGNGRSDSGKPHTFWFYSHTQPEGGGFNSSNAVYVKEIPLPVASVTPADGAHDELAKFVILPEDSAPDGAGMFLKVTADSKALPSIDWSQAELSDGQQTVKTGNLSSTGGVVSFPTSFDATTGLTLSLPIEPWYTPEQKSLKVSVNGGLVENTATAKSATLTLTGRTVNVVEPLQVQQPVIYGGQVRFTINLNEALPISVPLFLKVATSRNLQEVLKLKEARLLSGQLSFPVDLSATEGNAFTFNQTLSHELTLVIPLALPTALSEEEAKITLNANTGRQFDSARSIIGQTTVTPIESSASIEEGDGSLEGEIGESDLRKTFKLRYRVKNIELAAGETLPLALAGRQLKTPGGIAVSFTGPTVSEDTRSCKLQIVNLEKTIKLPAYLSYPLAVGLREKHYHGCRGEAQSIVLGNQVVWQESENEPGVKTTEIQLGFELNDPDSKVTLEAPKQEWIGTAKMQGTLSVKAVWNPLP